MRLKALPKYISERRRQSTKFKQFSRKQHLAMRWWAMRDYSKYDAIICDGAVRSGKTVAMSLGFVAWAMSEFSDTSFAMAGKTITALRRNIITPLISNLKSLGFECAEKVSRDYIDVTLGERVNRFYLFGGKDESSAALIQGITLGGIFLDEVALMPRSFVEQAVARCSLSGSRLWFSCNPEHPSHWFYKEWIQKKKQKNALRLHFTMDDNPSLSHAVKKRYERMYSGVFYDRFILGKWTASIGLVYPMFDENIHVAKKLPQDFEEYYISCDYGTVNPSSFGLWGKCDDKWYRIDEYYYDSRLKGLCRTDEEHYEQLCRLSDNKDIRAVIIDPSAASFIECIRRHGKFKVIPAKNDVLSGIGRVSDCISGNKICFSSRCKDSIREFSLYSWNENAEKDFPIKKNDHAMDDIRYFVSTVICPPAKNGNAFAISVKRNGR